MQKNKFDKTEYIAIRNEIIRAPKLALSNELSEKIDFLARQNIFEKKGEYIENINGVDVKFKAAYFQIKELADVLKQETSKSNIHRNIKNACQVLFNKTILIKKGRDFKLRHVFRDITCSNGQLMIVYESAMEPFFEFQGGFYTQYDKKMTLSLTKKGAFNLYLELKSYMYTLLDDCERIEQIYQYGQLRAMLGYMNIPEKDWEKAQKMIQKSNDWIGVNELDKKPKYKRFNDFITKIVYPAVEDINNKTDIEIEGIKIISHGRSQERKEIKFIIKKKNIVTSALKEEQDYIQFIRTEIFSDIEALTDSDINMFYKIAEKRSQNFSPLEYIQINYDYILDHDVEKENFVAYFKKALENDYAETNEI